MLKSEDKGMMGEVAMILEASRYSLFVAFTQKLLEDIGMGEPVYQRAPAEPSARGKP